MRSRQVAFVIALSLVFVCNIKRISEGQDRRKQTHVGTKAGDIKPLVAPLSEQEAKEHQSRCARALNAEVMLTNSIGMKLVLIPAGEFAMGDVDLHDPDRNEYTVHHVRVHSGRSDRPCSELHKGKWLIKTFLLTGTAFGRGSPD